MENPSHGPASYWTQTDALFRKNLAFQKRRKKANCRLILFPAILCALLVSLRMVIAHYKTKQPKPFPPGHVCSDDELEKSLDQCWILRPQEYPPLLQIPDPSSRAVRTSFLPFGDLPDGSCKNNDSCPATVLVTANNKSLGLDLAGRFFHTLSFSNTSDILKSFSDGVFGYDIHPGEYMYRDPAFSSYDIYYLQYQCHQISTKLISIGGNGMRKVIKCIKGLCLWRNSSSNINEEIFKGSPYGNSEGIANEIVAAYDLLNSSNKNFNVSIWYEPNRDSTKNLITRVARSVNMISNAYLEFLCGPNFKILFEFVKEMPKSPAEESFFDIVSEASTLFFTWIVLQLYPVILSNLVYEKQENIRIMMKMHGLGDGPYWTISYTYFLTMSSAYMLCFAASSFFLGLEFFAANDYSLQFVLYFVYINLQIAFCFLVAGMFSKLRTASVVAYLTVFGTGLVGKYYFQAVVDDPSSFPRNFVAVMELYPGLSLYRVFYEFSVKAHDAKLTHNPGMRWEDLNDGSHGLKEVLIIMVAEWFLFLLVICYIDKMSSIFCFRRKPSSSSQTTDQVEKADVTQEREKVEELLVHPNRDYAIICNNLRKVYPGKDGNLAKVAVTGLSLALPRGECFGMLGPNGAGKSSFIKMMIGLTRPSSGTAFVEGLNIQTDMAKVYTSIGVCPQHDLLWETLTAREHLLFYGRLKNLKGPALHRAVEESLSSLNLLNGGVADKQAGKYSGGMKRRLSVAISLIGDPNVVYMDEPSTGLDPASRKELWNVVKHAKANRAIILTTHSMEEAEHLCDRLGIFVDGCLQCIGNAKQLKARYGGSYVFTITTSSDNVHEMERLVHGLSMSANKTYHVSGTQKFELPKNEVRIADVFEVVEAAKSKFTVQAWGLADTTLEDVFVKVARGVQAFNII